MNTSFAYGELHIVIHGYIFIICTVVYGMVDVHGLAWQFVRKYLLNFFHRLWELHFYFLSKIS